MDYESRTVKWYWLLLFVVYCTASIYILFSGNPYLYSHIELRTAMDSGEFVQRQTIPAHPIPADKTGNSTFFSRYTFERNAVDSFTGPRSKNYEEYEHFNIASGIEDWDVQNIAQDQSGFYLTGKGPWTVAVDLHGAVRWKFRFKPQDEARGLQPPVVDEGSVYIVDDSGEVVSLNKISGEIRWVLELHENVVASPFIWEANLIVPTQGPAGVKLVVLERASGKVVSEKAKFDVKPGFRLSYSPDLDILVATIDNKVIAVQPDDWSVIWTATMTDPVRGPAVIVGNIAYVATLGAKVIRLDLAKKGKVDWEADLEKPAASPPAYLPVMNRLSVLDTSSGLSVIDAKTGKVMWRAAIENHTPSNETWSARIKGSNIEEFKMDWLHKGWTIWSPCGDRHFCIYTPNKGQLVNRIALSAAPMTMPLTVDRRLVFFGHKKGGGYVVSHAIEETEMKKLKKEAAE